MEAVVHSETLVISQITVNFTLNMEAGVCSEIHSDVIIHVIIFGTTV